MKAYRHPGVLCRRYLSALYAILIVIWAGADPVFAGESKVESTPPGSTGSLAIELFQKSLSKADGDRCPMYPSCSHYASQALKRHGTIKGWMLTFDRLLRCGHDEVRRSPKVRVKNGLRTFDPLETNTRWWRRP